MSILNLDKIFDPKRVAVIGASDVATAWAPRYCAT